MDLLDETILILSRLVDIAYASNDKEEHGLCDDIEMIILRSRRISTDIADDTGIGKKES